MESSDALHDEGGSEGARAERLHRHRASATPVRVYVSWALIYISTYLLRSAPTSI
jgi:hypothetical protein